jgi:hypothetical protein
MTPQPGDILVSRSSGTLEHQVTTVPDTEEAVCDSHDAAVARACALAAERRVDAWLTEDLTHFLRLAAHRVIAPST